MMTRCSWASLDNKLYQDYHDNEWGVQVHDDKTHFEFLVLEGAQAGLSWETILKRRVGYRKAFANFNVKKVANFTQVDFNKIIKNPGVIRNKLKIKSAINNAQKFIEIQNEFESFDKYVWEFVKNKQIVHKLKTSKDYPVFIKEAEELSKDLKNRGFTFVGPTIMYAHMQACGLVNDHTINCFRRKEVM
ncbi:DNA-3-methyladenine glycosylase I [Patescibacteria group bacterium]